MWQRLIALGAALFLYGGIAQAKLGSKLGPDGLHVSPLFKESFLELADDLAEARAAGKHLAFIVEQPGCIYCAKVHAEVLSDPFVANYLEANYHIIQLNLFGERPAVDLDGKTMPEKELVQRWGVMFTPTVVFLPGDLDPKHGKSVKDVMVATLPGAFGKYTYRNMWEWVASGAYKTEPNFQKWSNAKILEYRAKGLIKEE